MLNRRIQDLQNSRIEFARMIKELNVSIVKAESNINEMTELSKVTSVEIKSVVEEAKEATNELMSISEVANGLSTKLNNQVQLALEKADDIYANSMSQKAGERFTDDDLPEPKEENTHSYTNHLKNFIQNIVSKKSDETANLNQMSYYDTLRKINAKK
jgi:hypothetical protein